MSNNQLKECQDDLIAKITSAKDIIQELKDNFTEPQQIDSLLQPHANLNNLIYEQSIIKDKLAHFLDKATDIESAIKEKLAELKELEKEKINLQFKDSDKQNLKQEFIDFNKNNSISDTLTELQSCLVTSKNWSRKFQTMVNSLQNQLNVQLSESRKSSKASTSKKSVKTEKSMKFPPVLPPTTQQNAAQQNALNPLNQIPNQKSSNLTFVNQQTSQPNNLPTSPQINSTTQGASNVMTHFPPSQIPTYLPGSVVVNTPYQKPTKLYTFSGKHSEFKDFMLWFEDVFETRMPHWSDHQRAQQLKDQTAGAAKVLISAFKNDEYDLMKYHLKNNFGSESQIQAEIYADVKNLQSLDNPNEIATYYFHCMNLALRLHRHLPAYGDSALLFELKSKISRPIRAEIRRHLISPNTQDIDQYLEAMKQTAEFFAEDQLMKLIAECEIQELAEKPKTSAIAGSKKTTLATVDEKSKTSALVGPKTTTFATVNDETSSLCPFCPGSHDINECRKMLAIKKWSNS